MFHSGASSQSAAATANSGDSGDRTVNEPPFTKLERIGHGSFGEVFKGINQATGAIIAIKILNLEAAGDDMDEIQKEINVLSACDSPYITRYHGSYLVGSRLWIVMDYAGGGSVRLLMKPGPLAEKFIGHVARDVVHALVYLHKSGIIHRDIKAANILLTSEGGVKLCDFGVAGQVTMSSLRRNSFVGTPYWMAPEVIKRANYDFKADIWSLGITVYEMACGNPPLAEHDPMRAIFLIPRNPPPQLDGPNFSRPLKEFVATCLNDDPEQRPGADDLLKSSRFIKAAGAVPRKRAASELLELVARYQEWRARHGDNSDDDDEDDSVRDDLFDLDGNNNGGDAWLFDTVRSKRFSRYPMANATAVNDEEKSADEPATEQQQQDTPPAPPTKEDDDDDSALFATVRLTDQKKKPAEDDGDNLPLTSVASALSARTRPATIYRQAPVEVESSPTLPPATALPTETSLSTLTTTLTATTLGRDASHNNTINSNSNKERTEQPPTLQLTTSNATTANATETTANSPDYNGHPLLFQPMHPSRSGSPRSPKPARPLRPSAGAKSSDQLTSNINNVVNNPAAKSVTQARQLPACKPPRIDRIGWNRAKLVDCFARVLEESGAVMETLSRILDNELVAPEPTAATGGAMRRR